MGGIPKLAGWFIISYNGQSDKGKSSFDVDVTRKLFGSCTINQYMDMTVMSHDISRTCESSSSPFFDHKMASVPHILETKKRIWVCLCSQVAAILLEKMVLEKMV